MVKKKDTLIDEAEKIKTDIAALKVVIIVYSIKKLCLRTLILKNH